jgi:hypothetical protein
MPDVIRKPTDEEIRHAKGKCYINAFRFLEKIPDGEADSFWLVHGDMVGKAGDVKNTQFGHAWIENEDVVIDPGNDLRRKPKVYSRDAYYRLNNVIENSLKRYTKKQMYEVGLRSGGHFGPWLLS